MSFGKNDIGFFDPTGTDHDALGVGLKKALYNYMHGIGLEDEVRVWFDFSVPKTRIAKRRIERALGRDGDVKLLRRLAARGPLCAKHGGGRRKASAPRL